MTWGWCVEDYVPAHLLGQAVEAVHPRGRYSWDGDADVDPLAADRFGSRDSSPDKAAVAQEVIARWSPSEVWPHDLERRMGELLELIRRANR